MVEHSCVPRHFLRPEGEKSKRSKTIVEGDQNDVVDHPELRPKPACGPTAKHEGAPVQPDRHWEKFVPCPVRWNVDVQVQTVLVAAIEQAVILHAKGDLRGTS